MIEDNSDDLRVLLERAVPRRRQYVRRTPDLERKVLDMLALGTPLRTVAASIGIPASTISQSWVRSRSNPAFAAAFADAVAAGRRLNSDVAMARARQGDRKLRSLLPGWAA